MKALVARVVAIDIGRGGRVTTYECELRSLDHFTRVRAQLEKVSRSTRTYYSQCSKLSRCCAMCPLRLCKIVEQQRREEDKGRSKQMTTRLCRPICQRCRNGKLLSCGDLT